VITILKRNTDGTLLGADENGVLYDGECVEVGDDELTVTTEVSDDGESFERTTSYGDEIIAKGTVTREGLLQQYLLNNPDMPEDEQDSLWAKEVAIDKHAKTFVNVLIDGEIQSVEKKRKIIQWEARS